MNTDSPKPANMSPASDPPSSLPSCVENNDWADLQMDFPNGNPLLVMSLSSVDPAEDAKVQASGVMTFHTVGCSGDFEDTGPGHAVGYAMGEQVINAPSTAPAASFLYHLGDVVYKPEKHKKSATNADQPHMYDAQFYQQYAHYPKSIVAIAGNHDGKGAKPGNADADAPLAHFKANFCAPARGPAADNLSQSTKGDKGAVRGVMNQPYPYWLLETPAAFIIGLYTNVVNGGQLDDPNGTTTPQLNWLRQTLSNLQTKRDARAIIVALHYPPLSGTLNFIQRGDPTQHLPPYATPPKTIYSLLQNAFIDTKCYPDLVISAHAHLYQRITYVCANGWQIPYLIVGCGGHGPIEKLLNMCDPPDGYVPPSATVPAKLNLPANSDLFDCADAELVAVDETNYGFVSLTVDANKQLITGTHYRVSPKGATQSADVFVLDYKAHLVTTGNVTLC